MASGIVPLAQWEKQTPLCHKQKPQGNHRKGSAVGVLQNLLPGGQVPPGQHGIADIHIAVQMEKACSKPGHCRQYQGSYRPRTGQIPQSPGRQSPQTANHCPNEGQTHHHLPRAFSSQRRTGQGMTRNIPPGHEKPIDPALHRSPAFLSQFSPVCLWHAQHHFTGHVKLRCQGPADLGQTPAVLLRHRIIPPGIPEDVIANADQIGHGTAQAGAGPGSLPPAPHHAP